MFQTMNSSFPILLTLLFLLTARKGSQFTQREHFPRISDAPFCNKVLHSLLRKRPDHVLPFQDHLFSPQLSLTDIILIHTLTPCLRINFLIGLPTSCLTTYCIQYNVS